MKQIITYDLRTDTSEIIKPNRISVRAVIRKANKLFLVHLNKTNEYKFPGGGVEKGETLEVALVRETLEESGALITKIIKCFGYIDQIYPDKYIAGEIFSLRSIYYLCEIKENHSDLNLSASEESLGFTPCWVDIETAISTNQSCLDNGSIYHWTQRELYMFNFLKNNL